MNEAAIEDRVIALRGDDDSDGNGDVGGGGGRE